MTFTINLLVKNEDTAKECLIINANNKKTKITYHKKIYARMIDKLKDFKHFIVNIKTLYKLLNLIIDHQNHKIEEIQEKKSLKISFKIHSLNKILSIKLLSPKTRVASIETENQIIIPKKPMVSIKTKKNKSELKISNRKLILPPLPVINCNKPKLFLSHSWDIDSLNRDNHQIVYSKNCFLH